MRDVCKVEVIGNENRVSRKKPFTKKKYGSCESSLKEVWSAGSRTDFDGMFRRKKWRVKRNEKAIR